MKKRFKQDIQWAFQFLRVLTNPLSMRLIMHLKIADRAGIDGFEMIQLIRNEEPSTIYNQLSKLQSYKVITKKRNNSGANSLGKTYFLNHDRYDGIMDTVKKFNKYEKRKNKRSGILPGSPEDFTFDGMV